MAVTFVGHDTFLIQLPGLNILTDPIWSDRASPFSFFGPKRVRPPAIPFEQLPPIQLVLISHNHYDHLDRPTLRRLAERHRPQVLCPLGNRSCIADLGLETIELDWWDQVRIAELTITLTPAQHWSNRLWNVNRALWGGFWLESASLKLFFAGDTGYRPGLFRGLRQRLGRPDISLLPVGVYEPRYFMVAQHMNPDDAVRAHLDLESQETLGMHFGTFPLSDEGVDAPRRDLEQALRVHGVSSEQFRVPRFGETVLLTNSNKNF
jgi:L-ascorbate metabolism protein UlaG (beta-lactamase superfamily)